MEKNLKKHLQNGKFTNVPKIRSKTMAAIKGKNNKSTELKFKMALVRSGIRGWKLNVSELPGKPDFFFEVIKLAVFVDGCYWHGCPKCGHIPKTRSEYWQAKFSRNIQRDKEKNNELKVMGIKILRIWEHELKNETTVSKIIDKIKSL